MNHHVSRTAIALAILVISFLLLSAQAEDVDPISIRISYDKEQVNSGEEITATYDITGGSGEYSSISAVWEIYSGGCWIDASPAHIDLSAKTGSLGFAPNKGSKLHLWIFVYDSEGRSQSESGNDIPIEGAPDVDPVTVTISYDMEQVSCRQTVTATYSIIGGSGEYPYISANWNILSGGDWINARSIQLSDRSGSVSYTPDTGSKLYLSVFVNDSEGRGVFKDGTSIPIIDAPDVDPINIIISYDKEEVICGEEVRATYEIVGGSHEYSYISGSWRIFSCGDWIDARSVELSDESSGVLDFTPGIGTKLHLNLYVSDSEGRSQSCSGIDIPIIDAPDVDPISIVISYDKEEVDCGETVTATYRIAGGSNTYPYISGVWDVYSGGCWINVESVQLSNRSGSLTYTPKKGSRLSFRLAVRDSEGRNVYGDRIEIPIIGAPDVDPISIAISYDKGKIDLGEEITATYQITGGSGEYSDISADWRVYSGGSWITVQTIGLSKRSGSVSYRPSGGSKIYLRLSANDSENRWQYSSYGDAVSITDAPDVDPIAVTISYDKKEVISGDSINAAYKITGGNGKYPYISADWRVYSGGEWISTQSIELSERSGSIRYTPGMCSKFYLEIFVRDSEGREGYGDGHNVLFYFQCIRLNDCPSTITEDASFALAPYLNLGGEETFTFTSSDTSVLSVTSKGKATALNVGQANITVTGNSTRLTKSIHITVIPKDAPTIKATLHGPAYRTDPYYFMSFTAEISGGILPYACSYQLLRDNSVIFETAGDDTGFAVQGIGLSYDGEYMGRMTVTDAVGQRKTIWSDDVFIIGDGSTHASAITMGKPDYTLPSSVIQIEERAFQYSASNVVWIPDGCQKIGSKAFLNCSNLRMIRIPKNCSIASDAFDGCINLRIFGTPGSPAEAYAIAHMDQCIFVAE